MVPIQRWCASAKAFAAILVLFGCALTLEAWRLGVTVDEPSHVLSATLYWRGGDRLKPRDMPPLIKIAAGWVPHLLNPPYNVNGERWKAGHEWPASTEMMERFPPDSIQRFFFLSRLPLIAFPLLTAILIWLWARERAGRAAATVAAALFALEPTALGHGAFFKNDLAATFGYLLFWFTAWRFWKEPSAVRALAMSLGLLAAVLAKMSMLILIPIGLTLAALRGLRFAPLIAAVVYAGAAAACHFELRNGLPAPFVDGVLALAGNNAQPAPVYLNGGLLERGSRWYFLEALALKAPLGLQILILIGLWNLRRLSRDTVFVLIPPVLYIGLASLSTLQMGVRLILPALPFGVLIAAVSAERIRPRWALYACLALLAAESASVYPHGLAFFNVWAGGPEQGVHYLGDSNVDWGQSMGDLRRFMDANGIAHVSIAYFGMDQPGRYFPPGSYEFLIPPWGPEWAKERRLIPEKGRLYAISAGLLSGQLFGPAYRAYYSEFRRLRPIARAGQSIRIYRVD